MLKIQQIDV